MSQYKHLLFDADGTLYDFSISENYAIDQTWKALNIEKTEESVSSYLRNNVACWVKYEKGELTIEELKIQRVQLFFQEMGYDLDIAAFNRIFIDTMASKSVLFPESFDILTELKKRGYLLYIITNGIHEVQARRFSQAETRHLYEQVFTPHITGSTKPQKPYYDYVFRSIGIDEDSKKTAIAIGDGLNSDILGGINVGIDTVWYNPEKNPGNPAIQPTHEIASLHQLLDIFPPLQ
jgi:YjjG family noncanonical pyrimidine nucleotidase